MSARTPGPWRVQRDAKGLVPVTVLARALALRVEAYALTVRTRRRTDARISSPDGHSLRAAARLRENAELRRLAWAAVVSCGQTQQKTS